MMERPRLATSSIVVTALRLFSAGLYLAFTIPLISRVGAAKAGVILAAISAMDLAALLGRLGVPLSLTKARRLGGADSILSASLVGMSTIAAGTLGIVSWAVGLSGLLVVIGAASIAFNYCLAGWLRGASRFALAAAAHPPLALMFATASLLLNRGEPIRLYVIGSVVTSALLTGAVARVPRQWAAPAKAGARYVGSWQLGFAGVANQAVLLSLPVFLVSLDHKAAATVFSVGIGAFRPVLILQHALNFTIGPALAGHTGTQLSRGQRSALRQATGLLQVALIPYALVGVFVITALQSGFLIGEALPDLRATWFVLLLGHAVALCTGPTGQLLLLRGNEHATTSAAAAGLVMAILWFALPFEPWLRASGALTFSLVGQNVITALAAWRNTAWRASPRMALSVRHLSLRGG